jgi:acetyl esterase/lipase
MNEPVEDHWQYHAVMAIVRAHSMLANTKGVDPTKIGITGISWGGYLTAIAMAVDSRFALAVPVYGCGYITENSVWKTNNYGGAAPKDMERWAQLWDPMHYLPHAKLPVLWINGTNDFAYPLDSFQKSYQNTKNSCVSVGIELKHSHPDGWTPPEIVHFANSICRDEAPLPRFVSGWNSGNKLKAVFTSERPIMVSELCYTRALGMWQDRKWNSLPAEPTVSDGKYELNAELPAGTTCAFFNVFDDRGLRVSSHHAN